MNFCKKNNLKSVPIFFSNILIKFCYLILFFKKYFINVNAALLDPPPRPEKTGIFLFIVIL